MLMWFRGRHGKVEYIGLAHPDYTEVSFQNSVLIKGDGVNEPSIVKFFDERKDDFIFETWVKVDRKDKSWYVNLCRDNNYTTFFGFKVIGYFTWHSSDPLTAHHIIEYQPAHLYHIKFAIHLSSNEYDIYIDDMDKPNVTGADFYTPGAPNMVRYHAHGGNYGAGVRGFVSVNFIRQYTATEPTVTFNNQQKIFKGDE